jgi:hypothetical protein
MRGTDRSRNEIWETKLRAGWHQGEARTDENMNLEIQSQQVGDTVGVNAFGGKPYSGIPVGRVRHKHTPLACYRGKHARHGTTSPSQDV